MRREEELQLQGRMMNDCEEGEAAAGSSLLGDGGGNGQEAVLEHPKSLQGRLECNHKGIWQQRWRKIPLEQSSTRALPRVNAGSNLIKTVWNEDNPSAGGENV